MRQESLQRIALFMICLVISIPLYSAQTFATLTIYSQNSNGVQNYRALNDGTTVFAEVDQTGASPSSFQLFTARRTSPFQTCTVVGGKSVCTYAFAIAPMNPGKWDYSVSYTPSGQTVGNSIIVDNIAPQATILSLSSKKQITASYSVSDRAFASQSSQSWCSGIKRLTFTLGGQPLKVLELNFTPQANLQGTNCDYTGITTMNATSTGGEQKFFCIEAEDTVGNRANTCTKLQVDKEPPKSSNLHIATSNGKPITFVATPINAVLRFDMDEYNLSSVSVDASDFTVSASQKQSNQKAAQCNPPTCDGQCTCEVSGIAVNLPQGGDPKLHIHAKDQAENENDVDLQTHLELDNVKPLLTALHGRECDSQNVIGKSNNVITADFEESGSGLNGRRMYLDLSSVGGSAQQAPRSCTNAEAVWTCTYPSFNVPQSPGNSVRIFMNRAFSQDDIGNSLDAPTDSSFYNFVYDVTPPVLIDRKVVATPPQAGSAITEELRGFPVGGGTVQLTLTVNDSLSVTATADFSQVAHVSKQTVDCTGDKKKICFFSEIGPLYEHTSTNAPVKINLTDCAGNSRTVIVPINISFLETGKPNYWDYNVRNDLRMPYKIDKETLKNFDHRVYIPVEALAPGSIIPLTQQIVDCQPQDSTGYLVPLPISKQQLPDLLNAPSHTNLYGKFVIARAKDPQSPLNFLCVIKTLSRDTSNGHISQPEYDNVTFTLEFYNNLLGTIDNATKTKVEQVKNSALVQGTLIGSLQKVLNVLDNLCNTWKIFNEVIDTIALVGDILEGVAFLFPIIKPVSQGYNNGVTTPISEFVYGKGGTSAAPTAGVTKFISNSCAYISCRQTLWDLFLPQANVIIQRYKGASIFPSLTPPHPRDSLIMSIATLCIPGIIENLQKARAIECQYVVCMKTNIPQGIPAFNCDYQRAVNWCVMVWGEIFQLVPFTDFIDGMGTFVKNAISDPVTAIAIIFQLTCKPLLALFGVGGNVCVQIRAIAQHISSAADLLQGSTWKSFDIKQWAGSADQICHDALSLP